MGRQNSSQGISREDRELIADFKKFVKWTAWAVIASGGILTALLFLAIWQPLSDIREHTKDIASLKSLPGQIEASEAQQVRSAERLDSQLRELSPKVAVLGNLPSEMAKLTQEVAASNLASRDATTKVAQAATDIQAIKVQLGAVETTLDTAAKEAKTTQITLAALDARVAKNRRSFSVLVALDKPEGAPTAAGDLLVVRFAVPFTTLPALSKPDYDGLKVERAELQLAQKSTSTVVLDAQANREAIQISIWTTNDNLGAIEGAQAFLVLSRELP